VIRNSTQILVENLKITDGSAGLVAFRAGFFEGLDIFNCIIEGNGVDLTVSTASVVDVENSRVGSVEIEESSSLIMVRVKLTGTAEDSADFPFGILVVGGSRVDLRGVTQNEGIPNTVGRDSTLFASCADCGFDQFRKDSTLGDISVETLSRALITDKTTMGDLTCSVGADAICDGTEIKISSDCVSCPEF